jgi:hypothetical protein
LHPGPERVSMLRDHVAQPPGFGARHALQEVVVPAREGCECTRGTRGAEG